ncbi:aspartyl protease APCB1 isoform X2 [Physcomitrium patens]|uniref:Aspartic proteinase Asp1 n=1 Tax=Physcomitrium patens TaxID=3218 RepID=A0A2K1JCK4_PHYPA|nr:aspartyl protease APCB1-like isoform X2 [Physcomitrium patens]PNR39238.1 hypothetical protein PHYPA_019516 [Physcomitrium patens]|eukprot:XP_024395932.1 aspartyl protease APCB1-like isoform X2 [Physcomitrella patens]
MRGVMVISMPTDGDSKAVCAAVWHQDPSQMHLPALLPPQPAIAGSSGRSFLRRRRRMTKVMGFLIMLIFAILLGLRAPNLLTTEHQQENEDKRVHVYTLYPKFTTVPIKMTQIRRTLLERDLSRLGKSSVGNHSVRFHVGGNIYPDGLYYMALLLGSPPKLYFLDMDTGSDLTWAQCDAPCRNCAIGPHGLYNPKKAKVVDCHLPVCAQIQQGGSYECNSDVKQCDYEVEYADGSSTMGVLVEDTLTVRLTNGTLIQTKAIIGCGYDQQGTLAKSPASTDGVIGLSSSKVALPAQLAEKGIIKNVLGHCLADGSNGGGYLFFGDELVPSWGMTWTPMMGKPEMLGYQARLQSIRYGGDSLVLNNDEDLTRSTSSVMFDSGTSFTYLVPQAYASVLSAVEKQAKQSGLLRVKSDTTLPYCWRGPSPFQSITDVHQYFKTLTLDFGGRNWFATDSTLDLSPQGYLIVSTQGNVCLGILDASGASLEVTNIIGDVSMRGYLVVYDNVRDRIGWIRRNCHSRPTKTSSQFVSQVTSLLT